MTMTGKARCVGDLRHRRLGGEKQGLCTFNSAHDDVAVRRVAGRLPECETEMMGAQPCNRGQLANRKIVRQMRFDIVAYPVKTGRTRSEERSVGKGCGSKCRYRWWPVTKKKKEKTKKKKK